jgi:hypothetical protein
MGKLADNHFEDLVMEWIFKKYVHGIGSGGGGGIDWSRLRYRNCLVFEGKTKCTEIFILFSPIQYTSNSSHLFRFYYCEKLSALLFINPTSIPTRFNGTGRPTYETRILVTKITCIGLNNC